MFKGVFSLFLRGGYVWRRQIEQLSVNSIRKPGPDHSVVIQAKSQNELRSSLAILVKFDRHPASVLDEMCVSHDGTEYRLWVNCRNWPSRAGYYAGIIAGIKHLRRRRSKNLARLKGAIRLA